MYKHASHIVDIAKLYCEIPSVVGHEWPFLSHLERLYKHKGFDVEHQDGLLAVHGNRPHSHILCAHIDRHGIIKTGHNEYQYAAFVVEQHKYHLDYYKSAHLLHYICKNYDSTEVVAYNSSTWEIYASGNVHHITACNVRENLVFEINWLDENIPVGTPLSYSKAYFCDDEIFSAQIDNVISVASIQYLFDHGFQGTALLSCEEEIWQSWYYILEYIKTHYISWDNLLIIDTSPLDDDEELAREGKVILRNKDSLAIFNTIMSSQIEQVAQTHQIPTLFVDQLIDKKNEAREPRRPKIDLGITELGQLIKHTQGEYGGTSMQIPTFGWYHSNHESVALLAIENHYKLMALWTMGQE